VKDAGTRSGGMETVGRRHGRREGGRISGTVAWGNEEVGDSGSNVN